jgi:hypothetical protein
MSQLERSIMVLVAKNQRKEQNKPQRGSPSGFSKVLKGYKNLV